MQSRFKFFVPVIILTCIQCSGSSSIFPPVPTVTDAASVELPNPISVVADAANSQILVANSNVDIFFIEGSLMTISVDATTPTAPVLTATSVLATPNFAGEMAFDGNNAYLTFREGTDEDSKIDQIKKYAVGAGSLSETTSGSTDKNPFGMTLFNSSLFVVSDEIINLFDTDLGQTATIDLTTADTAGILDTASRQAESIVVDAIGNRAWITNRDGKMFIAGTDTNTVTHVIDGPTNSRGIAFDGTYVYVVDGNPPALWIFDPAQVGAPDSTPAEIDDSALLVAIIDLGTNPTGIAVDAANSRAYVANSGDRSISVIDTALFEEIDRISLRAEDTGFTEAKAPFGVAVGTYNAVPFVFVANFDSNTISVINGNNLKVVANFP